MKKLIVFILLFLPAFLYAQTSGRLINRIDHEITSTIRNIPVIHNEAQGSKSFSITFPSKTITIDAGAISSIIGTITLLSTSPVQINFHRTHLHLPDGWSTSVCFGASCYSTTTDSLQQGFTFTPQVSGSMTLDFYCPQGVTQVDSIIDYITLNVENGEPGDTASFILKGIYTPPSGVQDQPTAGSGNPRIKAIYPSPLVQGNTIKVKVSSPRESSLSYSIYDGIGRVVALGVTRQHIGLGDNTININSLDGLGNGSYMLKFNFGDGSSDTHFFQVIR